MIAQSRKVRKAAGATVTHVRPFTGVCAQMLCKHKAITTGGQERERQSEIFRIDFKLFPLTQSFCYRQGMCASFYHRHHLSFHL